MVYIALGSIVISVIALGVTAWMYAAWPLIQLHCMRRDIDPIAWLKKRLSQVVMTCVWCCGSAIVVYFAYWMISSFICFLFNNPGIIFGGLFILLLLIFSAGSTSSPGPNRFRVTHCYNCKRGLDSRQHAKCSRCGWITCPGCGACGCGYAGW